MLTTALQSNIILKTWNLIVMMSKIVKSAKNRKYETNERYLVYLERSEVRGTS